MSEPDKKGLYRTIYCDERGSIRSSAQRLLHAEQHRDFIKYIARLHTNRRITMMEKWERRNGKESAQALLEEALRQQRNPSSCEKEYREMLEKLFQEYLVTLPEEIRDSVKNAWETKHSPETEEAPPEFQLSI